MKIPVNFQIKTPQEILTQRNTSADDLKVRTQFLLKCLKKRYLDFFPTKIQYPQEIDRIISWSDRFKKLHECEGFDRHIKVYNNKDLYSQVFVTTVASIFHDFVELSLEPITPPNEGNPDIALYDGSKVIYIECKTINTEKYYDYDEKEKLARFVLEEISSKNQITLFFNERISSEEIRDLIVDEKLLSEINNITREQYIRIHSNITLNVIPRDYLGSKSLYAELKGIIEDNIDGVKKPAFVFAKNGRSVGIVGPVVDFSSSLESRRSKSKKQCVKNYPFVLVIDASHILGDPKDHARYINNWFARKNTRYSAVILFSASRDFQLSEVVKITCYENPYAENPCHADFIKLLNSKFGHKLPHNKVN